MLKINKEVFDEYVADKRLRVAKHPTLDLFIYNYTKNTEYNRLWDDITMTARGLVTDSEGNVHAWPFRKFFNIEQENPETIKDLFDKKIEFEVFEKMDGFLGIGFMYKGEFIISSRGSFISDPCIIANEIWNKKYSPYIKPLPNMTYVFEIIHNKDKIVVDYDFEDLTLLGARNNSSGVETAYENLKFLFTGNTKKAFPRIVNRIEGVNDFRKVREMFPERNDGNHEGFVIRFGEPVDGFRIKEKYSEYFRLSKILTGISTTSIWEFLRDGKEFDELLELVPDEFFVWVTETRDKLENDFHNIADAALDLFKVVYKEDMDKTEFANIVLSRGFSKIMRGLLFAQYDCKFDRFDESIWNHIKPKYETAFLNPMNHESNGNKNEDKKVGE